MTTKQLTLIKKFLAKFNCNVEQGREDFEHTEYMEDIPFIRFDNWLTVYQHENSFFVDYITSTGGFAEIAMGEEPEYETFATTDFLEATKYAAFRMIENEIHDLSDHLANEAETNLHGLL